MASRLTSLRRRRQNRGLILELLAIIGLIAMIQPTWIQPLLGCIIHPADDSPRVGTLTPTKPTYLAWPDRETSYVKK